MWDAAAKLIEVVGTWETAHAAQAELHRSWGFLQLWLRAKMIPVAFMQTFMITGITRG